MDLVALGRPWTMLYKVRMETNVSHLFWKVFQGKWGILAYQAGLKSRTKRLPSPSLHNSKAGV